MESENMDEFTCCLSNDNHFIIQPITSTKCGHSACKGCFPNDNRKTVKCEKCNVVSEFDFNTCKTFKMSFTLLYEKIFQTIEKETSSKIKDLKILSTNKNELLDLKVKWIEDEIDIRIESIKDQLEVARNNLRDELSRIKKSIEETKLNDENIAKYDVILKDLQNNIQNGVNLNEEWLDKYQKNLKDLNQLIKDDDQIEILKVLDFNVSEEIVTEKAIGEIVYLGVDVKELFLRGKTETIELAHYVFDIIALSNNRIACSSFFSNCLVLYDENFKPVKTIDKINELSFTPTGIASYDNHLYIADSQNHSIIKLDDEFNFIKSFGSYGADFNQFVKPLGICFKNGILYICDLFNQRIQICDKDLEFIDSVKVNYHPWMIKISNSLIFVEAFLVKSLFIYDLDSFSFKKKIDNPSENCHLSVIYSNLYRFNSNSKSLFLYHVNGDFSEEIIVNNVDGKIIPDSYDGKFIHFNGNLLMTSCDGTKLIKFTKD